MYPLGKNVPESFITILVFFFKEKCRKPLVTLLNAEQILIAKWIDCSIAMAAVTAFNQTKQ